MPMCVKCNRDVCSPCIRENNSSSRQGKIYVVTNAELGRRTYFRRLAIATAALKTELEISRREIPNWIADAIYGYDGMILWPSGVVFQVGDTDIDDAFNNDGSFRWLSTFICFADVPPLQAPQRRVFDRLRLIDLAFRIERPDTARHFGR